MSLTLHDCPPHDGEHETPTYPLIYDPLYYPDEVSVLSAVACDLPWLSASLMCYKSNLNCLTAPIPCDAAPNALDCPCNFEILRTELVSSSDDVLTQRFSMHLPSTSLQTRTTLIAAAVHLAYGSDVAAALCRSPVIVASSPTSIPPPSGIFDLHQYWLFFSLDELTCVWSVFCSIMHSFFVLSQPRINRFQACVHTVGHVVCSPTSYA
ncbi:uncharacterized protein HD556DRAFT_1451245 [Suillus plorans]|uniref:Uncharacterized protein n=1 Tax=Suillus plorans TaxID=116603 RepID=A0A9P7AB40_9AGAM|nr:uncharacterized protein HD556DRAFT_1451245 [Suillus plorans]KAG1784932.1 hypothetical protein HD556DRAFT_1451245 [Suillus plorans]